MRKHTFKVWCEFEFEGELHKSMENTASYFLLSQTGKLWTYEPGEAPQPLPKAYIKAIPLFYTGLKDKNGVKIFDGDIIRYKVPPVSRRNEIIEKVEWNEDLSGFNPFVEYDSDCGIYVELDTVEIIGNIYENPELLEAKK